VWGHGANLNGPGGDRTLIVPVIGEVLFPIQPPVYRALCILSFNPVKAWLSNHKYAVNPVTLLGLRFKTSVDEVLRNRYRIPAKLGMNREKRGMTLTV
jgi:hypothetical protein